MLFLFHICFCSLFSVSQETREGFTGPEEGEGGDSAAGDGEFEADSSSSVNTLCFILTISPLLSGTAGAPAE